MTFEQEMEVARKIRENIDNRHKEEVKKRDQELIKMGIDPNKPKTKQRIYRSNTLDKSEARIWYILIMIFGAITTAPLLIWIGASLWYFGKDRP